MDGVDCWDNREEVLEFVEVVGCCLDSAIEWIQERGVEHAEGKLIDNM